MNNYSIKKHSQTGQTHIERHEVTEHKENRSKREPESSTVMVSQAYKFSFNILRGE